MTLVSESIKALRSSLSGSVITAADPGYDEARRVWNAEVDRRPEVVANCATAQDVSGGGAVRGRGGSWRSRCAAGRTALPATA